MHELRLFTSESVTEGHPDKVCDQISDAILDDMLAQDPNSRVAIETLVTTGLVVVAGEVTTEGYSEIPEIVRETLIGIGYNSSEIGFDGNSCGVSVSIGKQSPDIAAGIDRSLELRDGTTRASLDNQGAGDQGLMFGFACKETPTLMPLPIQLAHSLSKKLAEIRKTNALDFLRPDGKTQVTIAYDGHQPVSVQTVVLSTQHSASVSQKDLEQAVRELVIDPVLSDYGFETGNSRLLVNPAGKFEIGGPHADAGLTGRKIIVDTYGGYSRHGGGAFSGKDPSKVDRSAAYAMRWVAKNVVAAGLAERVEIQVAYAIGKAHPVGLYVEAFGTNEVSTESITKAIKEVFDLSPRGIIQSLNLLRPIYSATSAYGHFGRELPEFTWEQVDRADDLRRATGN
jgi:S-adenosylmethionine synthetase